jgi:C1A family cysteine protease
MARKIQRYGWKPDLPDPRDVSYSGPLHIQQQLPPTVDLRSKCPPVYDQGALGSCTANAIAAAFEFDLLKQGNPDFTPSRLFIYYNERAIEGTIKSDAGGHLRDGIKSVAKSGVCHEPLWPYDIKQFAKKPPQPAYKEASTRLATSYASLSQNSTEMRTCLASGYPFVFGFVAYDSLESEQVAKSGILNMPAQGENQVGGHAVMAVGYNDKQQRFIVRNSWGDGWGQKGYFTMPYTYLVDPSYSSDFWTVRLVTE